MNRLNFWSRSSSKTRTKDAKVEAQASETPKPDDEATKVEPSTNESEHEAPLDTVDPQVEGTQEEAAKDDEQEQPLQRVDSAQNDDQDATSTATSNTSAPAEDAKDDSNKPQMPGGASTEAPHSEDVEKPTHQADSAPAPQDTTIKAEDSITTDQKAEDKDIESVMPGGASTNAANTIEPTNDAPSEQGEKATETTATEGKKQDEPTSEDLKNAAAPDQVQDRGLSDDSEQFLQRLTTHDEPQQPPSMSRRPTQIADNGDLVEPTEVPLPMSPSSEDGPTEDQKDGSKKVFTWQDRWNQWSFVPAVPTTSYFKRAPPKAKPTEDEKAADEKAADSAAADIADDAVKADDIAKGEEPKDEQSKEEAKEEQSADSTSDEKHEAKSAEAAQHRDLTHMLSNLKLSSLNNSVVGISHETQHLLENFTVVLKDVVNGGPEAYHDLDKLLTERGEQLDSLFGSMPPFLQTLVKAIPVKMYGAMAPQVAAAMSSESKDSMSATEVGSDEEAEVTVSTNSEKDTKKKKHGVVPSVQSLIKEQGTVAAMLRSILNFLQARFPLFVTGSNVLMSVAVFILLFVFWYCHKRGKQVRLSKKTAEKIAAESSLDDLEKQVPQPEKDAAAKVQAGEKEKEEAATVPLPQADESEKQQSTKSADEPAKKEESSTTESDVKSKPKPEAEPAPKTSADDATLQKLLNLQQKAVDEAHPAEDAASAADKIEDDASAATTSAETAKPKSSEQILPPPAGESVEESTEDAQAEQDYRPSMQPKVVTYDAKNESDSKENKKDEADAGSKISFGDLLKALEAHAKSAA